MEHIVLDPAFRGAQIRNNFGATLLDLRHTTLNPGKTYMDVECNFGGIELYVPSEWNLSVKADTNLAGYTDKRLINRSREYMASATDEKELIICGKLTLSGMEIKN
ncbi:MAG: cell wall-active antibiotics response protein [Bacteroides sp.]|nr:cell wall-active antibiotics response protein [Bacteroides sp.]